MTSNIKISPAIETFFTTLYQQAPDVEKLKKVPFTSSLKPELALLQMDMEDFMLLFRMNIS